jgi:SAM-dependent methyltransferase
MDNKQIRTAMVGISLAKPIAVNQFGEEKSSRAYSERYEAIGRISNWRQSLGLNLSIAARGATEGLWYVDLARDMNDMWESMMLTMVAPYELLLSVKQPAKVLYFDADQSAAPWLYNLKASGTKTCFVNNQTLWNFEKFMRDHPGEVDYDIDYHVVDRSEIGQGEASGFDLIAMQAYHVIWDNEKLLRDCVDALAPGGVLLLNQVNQSAKLYRDDYWFHPHNEVHKILKSLDGALLHDTGQ